VKLKTISLEELENRIDLVRIYMIETATLYGFTHPDTIKCSQELDILLNKYLKVNLKSIS